jgi:hypothetical protein
MLLIIGKSTALNKVICSMSVIVAGFYASWWLSVPTSGNLRALRVGGEDNERFI